MQSVGGYGVLAVACASSWLSIGGYSIPAIPTQPRKQDNKHVGCVGMTRIPYPPKKIKPLLQAVKPECICVRSTPCRAYTDHSRCPESS